jgi:hypothetical protein
MTPSQRSKRLLEKEGWVVGNVEKFIYQTKQRQDLWGFVDLIAMKPGCKPLLIQTTSGSNTSARIKKIMTERRDNALIALDSGFDIVVHGWRKLKKPRLHWAPSSEPLEKEDFL